MGVEAGPGERPGAEAVWASRLAVVLDRSADAGRVCRVDEAGRVLRVWALLSAAEGEVREVSPSPGAAARLQRQLDAITSELGQSVSPALAGELDHLIRRGKAGAPTPDELRVEYASLLGWTGGLVVGMLRQIEAASVRLARGGPVEGVPDMTGQAHGPGPKDLAAVIRAAGVSDSRVLEAIQRTPRDTFVPPAYADRAYDDAPIPLPHGQVTTQPSLSAAMIAALALVGTETVFEVGTGFGYQTALLAQLAARVVSIDIVPDLAAQARRNLAAQGIGNVVVLSGDGTGGAPDFAPFDAIVVSAACPRVPPPLAAQLRTGGRLVQPVGPGGREHVVLYEKEQDGLRQVRTLTTASFVQLRGRHGISGPGR